MTLHPALARLARGASRLYWEAPKRLILGARGYRFEGEQEAHAEQLRETQVSLSLMATASDDPEHIRMASEIEHGAENRLTVLLGKARLTMEEKGERDAIQRAISARRQSFAANSGLGGLTPANSGLRRLIPAIPAVAGFALRPWMLWAGALLMALTWGLYSDIRAGRAELRADENERLAETNRERAEAWQERAEHYRTGLIDAAEVARQAADALEAERQRQARAAARERRRQREVQDVLTGSPDAPDWRLRDDGGEDRDSGTPAG
jgi:hypothetical protein